MSTVPLKWKGAILQMPASVAMVRTQIDQCHVSNTMKVIDWENAEHYRWGGDYHGWYLLEKDDLSVIEEMVPPGGIETRHYHHLSQHFFYVLSVAVDLEVEGSHFELTAGSGLHVAAGKPHQLSNMSQTDARFLVISQPKNHGDRVDTRPYV